MRIFIPTYGRPHRQHTYHHLPAELQKRTTLVVQHRERHAYKDYPNVHVLPSKVQTISPTRHYIMTLAHKEGWGKVVMLDDDLHFSIRRKNEPDKFTHPTDKQVVKLFERIEKELDKFTHVGVLAREGGNRITKPHVEVTRMMRVLAYNVEAFHAAGVRFYRGKGYETFAMEDFDTTLQLLRKGHPNRVLCGFVHNQGGSNTDGGCSHFRTLDVQNTNAALLAKIHDPFVKVVEKTTKTAWGGATRLDVTVQWKKAFASSQG